MKNRYKKAIQVIALALCTILILVYVAPNAHATEKNNQNNEETKEETREENGILPGENSCAGEGKTEKDETVYVFTDASGNVEKVIVSDWLKNTDSFKTIDDYSDLKNIENLKGYETFEAAGNNEQKWDAKGNGKEQTVQGSLTRVRQVLWKRFRCGCCGKIHIRQRTRLLKRPSYANKI